LVAASLTMTLPFTTVSAVILQYELSLEWPGTQLFFCS
jgi:hypothetical protein